MQPELIITNKKTVKKTLNMGIIFIIACLALMGLVYRVPSFDGVKIFILIVFSCLLIFLIFRFFQFLKLYLSKTPAMVINSQGIWTKEYDIIPWSNIASIEEYNPIKLSPLLDDIPTIGIKLHDPEIVLEKASPIGKRYLWIALKCNQPYHVMLTDMDTPTTEIVNFALQFKSYE